MRRVSPHCLTFIVAMLLAPTAYASGLTADSSLTQQFLYDSNPLRLDTDAEGIFGSTTAPSLTLSSTSPRHAFRSHTRVAANYFDDSVYNSIDASQDISYLRRNERWQAGAKVGFAYDTVRTSEISNFAVRAADIQSERWNFVPELAYRPSTRERLAVTGEYSTTRYDSSAFTNYELYSLNPSYERTLSPIYTGILGLHAQRYEADTQTTSRSDSFGPTLGLKATLTPRLTSELRAGALATDKRNDTTDQQLLNYVFRGSLKYKTSQDTAEFLARRAREPFGNGTETLLTTFGATLRHQLAPLLALKAEGKYHIADYEDEPGVNLDHSETIGGGLAYTLDERTELAADYRFRTETLTTIHDPVDQHLVMLSITYRPTLIE